MLHVDTIGKQPTFFMADMVVVFVGGG